MKSREAKSILNKFRNGNYNNPDDPYFREIAHALDVILPKYVELEKRDTPMKPLIDKLDLWDEHKCPICESTVWEVHVHKDKNFCNKCGQRLDWSNNND